MERYIGEGARCTASFKIYWCARRRWRPRHRKQGIDGRTPVLHRAAGDSMRPCPLSCPKPASHTVAQMAHGRCSYVAPIATMRKPVTVLAHSVRKCATPATSATFARSAHPPLRNRTVAPSYPRGIWTAGR